MRGPSPLLGYNTNVRHKGKLYHIQTEDSGVNHPHIITHLFADGGRIIASKKTDYAQYLGSESLQDIVKKLMQEQHKAMFIALRDCVYDEDEDGTAAQPPRPPTSDRNRPGAGAEPIAVKPPELDLDALERAAEAKLAQSAASKVQSRRAQARRRSLPANHPGAAARANARARCRTPNTSIFNGQVLRNKSLDEVILSYLADDSSDDKVDAAAFALESQLRRTRWFDSAWNPAATVNRLEGDRAWI